MTTLGGGGGSYAAGPSVAGTSTTDSTARHLFALSRRRPKQAWFDPRDSHPQHNLEEAQLPTLRDTDPLLAGFLVTTLLADKAGTMYNGMDAWSDHDIPSGSDWSALPGLDDAMDLLDPEPSAPVEPVVRTSPHGRNKRTRQESRLSSRLSQDNLRLASEEDFEGMGTFVMDSSLGDRAYGKAEVKSEDMDARPTSPVWSSSTPSSMSGDSESDDAGGGGTPDFMSMDASSLEAGFSDDLRDEGIAPGRDEHDPPATALAPPRQGGAARLAAASCKPCSASGSGDVGGNLVVGCEFDLRTKQWNQRSVEALPYGFNLGELPSGPFRSLSAKGRHSREERESERRAQEILRSSGWSIDQQTNFEDLECLVSALARWLDGASGLTKTNVAWCVGGSLDATLRGRDRGGRSHTLRFVLCERSDWTGDRKTTKIGNTCRWHAGGLNVTNCVVDGVFRPQMTLRKCTWMKCCYGRKHYGDPPNIAWCNTCEYQKKLSKKQGGHATTSASTGGSSTPNSGSRKLTTRPAEPCHDCLHRMLGITSSPTGHATRRQSSEKPCGSCTKLVERAERFVRCLTIAAAQHPVAAAAAGGLGAGGKPLIEPPKAKAVVLRQIASIDLQAHSRQVEPILLDALLHRYEAKDADTLWATSSAARSALSRLVLDDISVAHQIHQGLVAGSAQHLQPCSTATFLKALPMPQFLSCWQQAGASSVSVGAPAHR